MDTLPPPPPASVGLPTAAELALRLAIERLPHQPNARRVELARQWLECIRAWPEEHVRSAVSWLKLRRRPPTLVDALPGWRVEIIGAGLRD